MCSRHLVNSRIPVYKDTIDDIIGILYEKDFHNYVAGTTKSIETIMKPAEFIPPTVKISELLKKFQQTKLHIAVVVDEFGGTEGIVTMENILEELVGDIWDEHDEVEAGIKKLDDGSFIVPEDMDLDDFFDAVFHQHRDRGFYYQRMDYRADWKDSGSRRFI